MLAVQFKNLFDLHFQDRVLANNASARQLLLNLLYYQIFFGGKCYIRHHSEKTCFLGLLALHFKFTVLLLV